jgi:hypothetical protein
MLAGGILRGPSTAPFANYANGCAQDDGRSSGDEGDNNCNCATATAKAKQVLRLRRRMTNLRLEFGDWDYQSPMEICCFVVGAVEARSVALALVSFL